MLGAWARAKPRGKSPIDLLLVGLRVLPTQVLAHHLRASIEEVERQPERPRGNRGGGHALIAASGRRNARALWVSNILLPNGTELLAAPGAQPYSASKKTVGDPTVLSEARLPSIQAICRSASWQNPLCIAGQGCERRVARNASSEPCRGTKVV